MFHTPKIPIRPHLNSELKSLNLQPDRWKSWNAGLHKWREEWEQSIISMVQSDQAPLNYARLCHEVSKLLNESYPETPVFVDTGHLLSFVPPFYRAIKPRFFHNGFFHRMGWSLPAQDVLPEAM